MGGSRHGWFRNTRFLVTAVTTPNWCRDQPCSSSGLAGKELSQEERDKEHVGTDAAMKGARGEDRCARRGVVCARLLLRRARGRGPLTGRATLVCLRDPRGSPVGIRRRGQAGDGAADARAVGAGWAGDGGVARGAWNAGHRAPSPARCATACASRGGGGGARVHV